MATPKRVSMEEGVLESKVFDASTPLLRVFHETAQQLSMGVCWHELRDNTAKDLSALLCKYLRAFKVRALQLAHLKYLSIVGFTLIDS